MNDEEVLALMMSEIDNLYTLVKLLVQSLEYALYPPTDQAEAEYQRSKLVEILAESLHNIEYIDSLAAGQ